MKTDRLSSENLHATTVTRDGRAIMIVGPSGSGKSDLALRLFDRGFALVSDDRTLVRKAGGRLFASAPPMIRGKIEVRGIGIIEVEPVDDVAVVLVVDLSPDVDRLPDEGASTMVFGVELPTVTIDARAASAAIKVDLALARIA